MSNKRQGAALLTGRAAGLPRAGKDEARLAMMRRVKAMTLDERIDLFERLARDTAWARTARRVK